jgi:hypothetical protein
MRFKENTSPEKLQEALGRETTEKENEASIEKTDYSVDYVFCPICEKHFGKIESEFADKFLKKLRMNPSLENASKVEFKKAIQIILVNPSLEVISLHRHGEIVLAGFRKFTVINLFRNGSRRKST